MKVTEIVVKTNKQRLRKAYILGGNDKSQRECTQDKNQDCYNRAYNNGFRIVTRGIIDIHNVDTHHLHTRIKEEYTARQNKVIQFFQIGEESLRHIHIIMAARSNINNAQNNEQTRRNDSTYHTTPLTDFTYPIQASHRYEGRNPIDSQHHYERKHFIRGQRSIVRIVHTDKRYRHGAKCKHRRVPNSRLNPLQPYSQETHTRAISLTNPAEDSTLLVGEHSRQLRRNHSRRNQEDDCRKEIIERR